MAVIVARLHLYPPDHNAGAEWMVHSMLRALVARGHRCEVWLSRYSATSEPYDIDGVYVWPFGSGRGWTESVHDSDAVLTHLENTPVAAVGARRGGRPLIIVNHNTHPLTKRWARAGADLLVHNSQWMRDDIGVDGLIVRPPVFAEEYATTPGECITLVNLIEAKGADTFYQLAKRFPDRKFLGVIGAYGEQDIRAYGNVEIVRHTSGHFMRDEVYGRTRILLMPSSYESWGRCGVEAMASGIPVIAHPTPGLRESLGSAGLFADRVDVDRWASTVECLDDPKVYAEQSDAAKRRVAELDPTEDLRTWCDAVEALTEGSNAHGRR